MKTRAVVSLIIRSCLLCTPLCGCTPKTATVTDVDPLVARVDLVVESPAGDRHNMLLIPEGEFEMGTYHGDINEAPVHAVFVDSFYIDKYEVNNEKFLGFLSAVGEHQDEKGNDLVDIRDLQSPFRYVNYRFELKSSRRRLDLEFHPVTEVTWHGARGYCRWAGLRLPTEAEWEKAARGSDGRLYPWGEVFRSKNANSMQGARVHVATARVGHYPRGVSPFGVHDMAGNVQEWVADWFAKRYYELEEGVNPKGPSSGLGRVLRGGSWRDNIKFLTTTARTAAGPSASSDHIGFRCAKSL
jgi:sulfatase modifying factor 1